MLPQLHFGWLTVVHRLHLAVYRCIMHFSATGCVSMSDEEYIQDFDNDGTCIS